MKKPKILIIDDEQAVRVSIEDALSREGYELFFAENGKEGLSLFKEVSPVLVLLDLRMPVMDGFEFLDKIKPKPTDSFLVTVVTGHSLDEDVIKCYDLGVNSFFRKPFNFVELRCMVQRSIKLIQTEEQVRRQTKERQALQMSLEKEKAEMQLMQMDKMSSLGSMAAGVAHEINNPLNVATGDIYLFRRDFRDLTDYIERFSKMELPPDILKEMEGLKKDMDLPYILEKFDKKISRCEDAMKRIKGIVNQLREFSHPDKGETGELDINKNIKSTLEMIPKKYKQNIEIKMEFASLPEIPCHGRQISQIFMNIIINALQAMKGGGMLKIETSSDDNRVYIKFRDMGPGIPEDKIKEIFDPFYTTKPAGEGTGLGLSICNSIIEKHGGDITVVNNPDKGATFTVKIPKSIYRD